MSYEDLAVHILSKCESPRHSISLSTYKFPHEVFDDTSLQTRKINSLQFTIRSQILPKYYFHAMSLQCMMLISPCEMFPTKLHTRCTIFADVQEIREKISSKWVSLTRTPSLWAYTSSLVSSPMLLITSAEDISMYSFKLCTVPSA